MGLNPGIKIKEQILGDLFNGGSPYFDMFKAGVYKIPIEDCIAKCMRNGIALRPKDIDSYEDGVFKGAIQDGNQPRIKRSDLKYGMNFDDMKLTDFPKFPIGWKGTNYRFFPCSKDNKPLQKWGWKQDEMPELYLKVDAKALSPCGWVGQNMLYQPFIVMDIDGRGHGVDDYKVIAFGEKYKHTTYTMEDPNKPGSFHLYFSTDRLIPVRHFPWAKLDLMGNAVNAAVYFKDKKPNGIPPRKLDEYIWDDMMAYQKRRKEEAYVS